MPTPRSHRRDRPDERLHRPPLRLPRPGGGPAGALRWLVAAALLALAAVLLAAGNPPAAAAPSVTVVVAAHDLAGGAALTRADLRTVRLPRSLLPRGILRNLPAALGRSPAGPVRRGEALTDVRLLGPALIRAVGGQTLVAAPVRIADPGAVALLRPGDRVDVLAGAHRVAAGLPVIEVPPAAADGAAEGALVVLAAAPATAAALVGAAATNRLSITVSSR